MASTSKSHTFTCMSTPPHRSTYTTWAPTVIPVFQSWALRLSSKCRFVCSPSPGKLCLGFIKMGSMPDGFLSLVCRGQWSCPFLWRVWKDTKRYWSCCEACYLRCRCELLSRFSTVRVSWRCKQEICKRTQSLLGRVGRCLSVKGSQPHTFFVP